MTLSLSVTCYAGQRPAAPIAVTLGEAGGVIGRQPGCDWVLDDPEGHISKRHCRIEFDSDQFRIIDTSTNGVFLNDSANRIDLGVATALSDGDLIYIGPYVITAHVLPADHDHSVETGAMPETPTAQSTPLTGSNDGRGEPAEPRAIDLLQAFLEGAGLSTELLARTEPEAMLYAAGRRLRSLVAGLRAVAVTAPSSEGPADNPLSRSFDDEQALLALLSARPAGDMDALIRHSFDELAAYQTELRTRSDRTAATILARLDPDTLMGRIEGQSLLAAFKKARYWDLFQLEFNRLRADDNMVERSAASGNFIRP
jgi:predicted component of type VI protein secretion system